MGKANYTAGLADAPIGVAVKAGGFSAAHACPERSEGSMRGAGAAGVELR